MTGHTCAWRSKETEAHKEHEAEVQKPQKPNGYLFDPDEESDDEQKTPTDESGVCLCVCERE